MNENQAIGASMALPADPSQANPDGERILKRLEFLRGKLADIQGVCVQANERARKIKQWDLDVLEKAESASPRNTVDLVSRLDEEIDCLFSKAEAILDTCNETDNLLALVVGS